MTQDSPRRLALMSLSAYRVRRVLPWLALAALVVFIQFHFTAIRESYLIKNTLEALVTDGKPDADPPGNLSVLLIAYARTGSSFFGDLLQSFPNVFYHFEPVHFIQGPVLTSRFDETRNLLNSMFTCNISQVPNYIDWVRTHKSFMKFQRNIEYWKECSTNSSCYDGAYIDAFCRNRTTRVVKSIRLNLLEASHLITSHPDLRLKIIYLARDPRGTMNSRRKPSVYGWCKNDPMCSEAGLFCDGLKGDVEAACHLLAEHPQNVLVVRYEDMATSPFAVTAKIARFMGFESVPPQVVEFLKSHTYYTGSFKNLAKHSGLAYSYMTVRNSSMAANSWRREMSFQDAARLQDTCKDFLSAFGYHNFKSLPAMRSNADLNSNLLKTLQTTCESYNS